MNVEKRYAKTAMDDLTDVEEILGYAQAAKESKDTESANFFLSRAKRRMSEYNEDMMQAGKKLHGDAWEMMSEFLGDKAEHLQHKIDKFSIQ